MTCCRFANMALFQDIRSKMCHIYVIYGIGVMDDCYLIWHPCRISWSTTDFLWCTVIFNTIISRCMTVKDNRTSSQIIYKESLLKLFQSWLAGCTESVICLCLRAWRFIHSSSMPVLRLLYCTDMVMIESEVCSYQEVIQENK